MNGDEGKKAEEVNGPWYERALELFVDHVAGGMIEATLFLTVAHFWPEAVKWTVALIIVLGGAKQSLTTSTLNIVNDAMAEFMRQTTVISLGLIQVKSETGQALLEIDRMKHPGKSPSSLGAAESDPSGSAPTADRKG